MRCAFPWPACRIPTLQTLLAAWIAASWPMAAAGRDTPPPAREWFAQIVAGPWEKGSRTYRFVGIDPVNAEATVFASFEVKRGSGNRITSFTRTGHLITPDVHLMDHRGRLLDTWDLKMRSTMVSVSPNARTWLVARNADYPGRPTGYTAYLMQGLDFGPNEHRDRIVLTDWEWSSWCWEPPISWSPHGSEAATYYTRDIGGDIHMQDYGLAVVSMNRGITELVQPPGRGTPYTEATTLPPRWGSRSSTLYYTGPRPPEDIKEKFPHTNVCVYRVSVAREDTSNPGEHMGLGRLTSIDPSESYVLVDQYPTDDGSRTRAAKITLANKQVELLPEGMYELILSPSGTFAVDRSLAFYKTTDWSLVSRFDGGWERFGQPMTHPDWIHRIPIEPAASVSAYDDVRWAYLGALDLSTPSRLIETLWFSHETVWPPAAKMPAAENPQELLEKAKNPGLGVHAVHGHKIRGDRVKLGIIGYPIHFPGHPDITGRLGTVDSLEYRRTITLFGEVKRGDAAASVLLGQAGGVAPESRAMRYVEVPWNETDGGVYAKALHALIEHSKYIRIVVVAAAPQTGGLRANQDAWQQAVDKAEAANMLVVALPSLGGWVGPCWYDPDDPENPERCQPGLPDGSIPLADLADLVLAPAARRTAAMEYDRGHFGFQYCGPGCPEWAVAYCGGVLALGCQAAPELPVRRLKELLYRSAHKTDDGLLIIQPKLFVKRAHQIIGAIPPED